MYGNIVNKVINGNIVNMMLKIIENLIYNTSPLQGKKKKIYIIKLSFAIKVSYNKILIKASIILYTASYRKPRIKTPCSRQGIRNNIIFSFDMPDVKIVFL